MKQPKEGDIIEYKRGLYTYKKFEKVTTIDLTTNPPTNKGTSLKWVKYY